MKSLHDHLKTVYEKHSKAYDELSQITTLLKQHKHTLPPALQVIISQSHITSYRHGVLTIDIPQHFFSPEVGYYAVEIKKILYVCGDKAIRAVRFTLNTDDPHKQDKHAKKPPM